MLAFHKKKSILTSHGSIWDILLPRYAKGRTFNYGNTIKYEYTMVQVEHIVG